MSGGQLEQDLELDTLSDLDTELDTEHSTPPTQGTSTASALYATLSIQETADRLHTSTEHGLDLPHDINHRRTVHGPNELVKDDQDSVFKRILMQVKDPLILLLLGSAAVSLAMGNSDDAVSITLAISIVLAVGFVQEYKSEKSLEALNKLVPAHAHLTRGPSNTHTVLAANLVPGDLVHFDVGDRIPADIRLTEATDLEIDESNLTGETEPVFKSTETVVTDGAPPVVAQRKNIVFMGTLVCGGKGSGIVVGTAKDTEFGAVFEMMKDVDVPKTPLQVAMNTLGKELSYISFAVIAVIATAGVLQGRSWLDMFTISVSLAVAAIPEGLPIIVTVTLALGVLRMASEKAIVRRLPSVETLSSVNVICSDKTGTLTKNQLTLTKVWTAHMGAAAPGTRPWLSLAEDSDTVCEPHPDVAATLETAALCSHARISSETGKYFGNATDAAILTALARFGMSDTRGARNVVAQVAFSSSRKWMWAASRDNDSATRLYCKGALDKVLPMCSTYLCNGKETPFDDKQEVYAAEQEMAREEGVRILAVAYGPADKVPSLRGEKDAQSDTDFVSDNLTFCGIVGMYDPPRPGVQSSIQQLRQGGVRVIMITGDSEATAETIARKIGIPLLGAGSVMNGKQLDRLSLQDLAAAITHVSVFARTSPEHKLQIVKALQRRGDVVAMTGDGVNDAPALKLADIGISMGQSGTDVAKEASDMILVDDDFSTILSSIRQGKAIFSNIQAFLKFQLSTSVAALALVAIATLCGVPSPLNAMQILWINIIMDGPPAQSLGVEPADEAVMKKPPRSRNDRVLTMTIFARVMQSGLIMLAGTLAVFLHEMRDKKVSARDTTMTFTCFVLFDMFNALVCRSASKSVVEIGIFSNKMLNWSVGGSMLGQLAVIYLPFLQKVFQTEALSLIDLAVLVAIASMVLVVEEARKAVCRYFCQPKTNVGSGYTLV